MRKLKLSTGTKLLCIQALLKFATLRTKPTTLASLQALRALGFALLLRYVGRADFCEHWHELLLLAGSTWLIFRWVYQLVFRRQLWALVRLHAGFSNLLISTMVLWVLLHYYGDGGLWQISRISGSIILSLMLVLSQKLIDFYGTKFLS